MKNTLAGMILVGVIALSGANPALAAYADVKGSVNKNGKPTVCKTPRTTESPNIGLGLTNKTSGNTYFSLVNVANGKKFTNTRTFKKTEFQYIGTNVKIGTKFYMSARMDRKLGPFSDNKWAGGLSF